MPLSRAIARALAATTIVGCSLFTPLDGFITTATDVADASDAASIDSGVDVAVAEAGDAGASAPRGPNLHHNGTFDLNCDGWGGYQGNKATVAEPHTGPRSCRFCGDDPT